MYIYIYIYIYTRSSDVQVRTEFFEIYPSTLLLLTFPLDNNRNSLLLKSSSILTGKIINLFTSLPGILFFYLFWTNCNVRQLKARVVNFEFEILYRGINNIFITYFELSFHGSSLWQTTLDRSTWNRFVRISEASEFWQVSQSVICLSSLSITCLLLFDMKYKLVHFPSLDLWHRTVDYTQ